MAIINVNLRQTNTVNSLLSEGWYSATIFNSEVRNSSAGDPMVVWTWKLDNGRFLRDYTVINQELGVKKLQKMVECCGLYREELHDTAELHGKRCEVKVGVKNGKNWIDGFSNLPPFTINKVTAIALDKEQLFKIPDEKVLF